MSNRVYLLKKINLNTLGSPYLVGADGGVNFGASADNLGGGTINVYELPDQDADKPLQPIYSTNDGTPKRLNVTKNSWLMAELVGATAPQNVSAWFIKN